MNLSTRYILTIYLKYFFIVFFSLEIFFVGFDYMWNVDRLPHSTNLQLLYIIYTAIFLSNITLPLSLVFGFVIFLSFMIKENILVSLYSLGISKIRFILPIVIVIIFINFIYLAIQTTNLAYSKEKKDAISKGRFFESTKNNLFLKYKNNYIYMKSLSPIEKKAQDIHIFTVKDNQLIKTTIAKKAIYQKEKWYIIDVKIIDKPKTLDIIDSKLNIYNEKFINTLEGFKPDILNNIYKNSDTYSIYDAIYAILLLSKQGIDTNSIRAYLYGKIFIPFFSIALIIFLFYSVSSSNRFFKMGLFISMGIFSTLLIWGSLFFMQKLAISNILNAELAIILPICLLYFVSFYKGIKNV